MVRVNETDQGRIDQSLPEKVARLRSEGKSELDICNLCEVQPEIVKKILSTIEKRFNDPSQIPPRVLQILCKLSKQGTPLNKICETLEFTEDQVFSGLAQVLGVSSKEIKIILRMKSQGKSIQEISNLCVVALDTLLQIFPEENGFKVMEPRLISSEALVSFKKLKPFEFEAEAQQGVEQRDAVELMYGEVYQGEWSVDNLRHGRGVQEWPNGRRFEGHWSEGKRNGKGRLIKSNGSVWECNWADDYPYGKISATTPNGTNVTGLFTTKTDGNRYEGYWENDMPNGKGC